MLWSCPYHADCETRSTRFRRWRWPCDVALALTTRGLYFSQPTAQPSGNTPVFSMLFARPELSQMTTVGPRIEGAGELHTGTHTLFCPSINGGHFSFHALLTATTIIIIISSIPTTQDVQPSAGVCVVRTNLGCSVLLKATRFCFPCEIPMCSPV
ncbi:hypothetical protein BC827DRAFT_912502 [Russula dissimulans]|nr:hypothetical protein BC827DRAFT_912502 [Russula dissimulans]